MNRLKSGLQLLYNPMAIGIYITLSVMFLAFNFYIFRGTLEGKESDLAPVQKILNMVHQKSVDFRLTTRGPRKPSDQVALIAVDDRSVERIGRWPWPRKHIATIVNETMDAGAASLGFDMTFSEPSLHPTKEVLSQLQEKKLLNSQILKVLQTEVVERDQDLKLRQAIETHKERVVLGNFSTAGLSEFDEPFRTACFSLIYQQEVSSKVWQKDAVLPFVMDGSVPMIPEMLIEAYKMTLKTIAEGVTEQHPDWPKGKRDKEALGRQRSYCFDWLDPEQDSTFSGIAEVWPTLVKQDPEVFNTDTYEEWAQNFKSSYLPMIKNHRVDWVMNINKISEVAHHNGYFNAELDSDGTIRRKSLISRTFDQWMPSIAFKSYLVANRSNGNIAIDFDFDRSKKVIQRLWVTSNETGDDLFDIPVDLQGNLTLNYAGPRHMFPYISAAELVEGQETLQVTQKIYNADEKAWVDEIREVPKKEFLKDKILIIGATAMGIFDLRVTPFDENYPGAETHLNVIDNLIRNDFFLNHPDEEKWMLIALLILGIAVSFAIAHLGPLTGLSVVLSLAAGTYFADRLYLFGEGIVVAVIFPLLLIFAIYGVLTFYKYFSEERNKRELRNTFQKYVSPAIVDEILSDPSNIQLGGKKVETTVFFSDVRGFTTISEKLDPEALSDLLNFYLTPMTELVFENKGTLDKYMGDAIMAFFGAPIQFDDHATWACRCALRSLEKLTELQIELEAKGLPSIDIGIGLNSGEVSVGNMGSETVRSYTVMGDTVNLASRLEAINKQYGTRIIISEFTHKVVASKFLCREVDRVRVKGKQLPVKIFELISEGEGSPQQNSLVKKFCEGYNLYHQKEFSQALECFNSALSVEPTDVASQLYVDRCEEYINEAPPIDWDGVFDMKTK